MSLEKVLQQYIIVFDLYLFIYYRKSSKWYNQL